jgi:phospholipid/cholesterol/gamma-HCH transport system ATP-binding protein
MSCSNLRVTFGEDDVLRDATFAVERGEIVGIVGRSGEGKTTLLKASAGLIPVDEGTVELLGEDLWQAPTGRREELRRHFGFVFQGGALFDSLTVAENAGFFPRRVQGRPAAEARDVATEKLGLVGLHDVEDLLPAELSGGMAKRVAIARALAMEPDALLFDEPTAHLDPATCRQLEALIVRLRQEVGVAAVVVSHDLASLCRIADRIILLHEGEVALESPAAEFAASDDPRVVALLAAEGGTL